MSSRMIEELFARRTRNLIGKIRSHRQDLTFEQLKIYYNEAGFDIGEKFAANLELLTEDGAYNYAAYLLADKNGNSVQVAKYAGIDRVDLIESNEYGYCRLIKTCKQVLDKLDLENRPAMKITSKELINKRLWNSVALREAVINEIIHNDYTNEAVPKFEIFDDRIEITSAGSIPPGVEQDEFFQGYSIPRNRFILGKQYYRIACKTGVYTRKKVLDRETCKALILKHVRITRHVGSKLGQFFDVLPGRSRGELQSLLCELCNEGKMGLFGATSSSLWFPID